MNFDTRSFKLIPLKIFLHSSALLIFAKSNLSTDLSIFMISSNNISSADGTDAAATAAATAGAGAETIGV